MERRAFERMSTRVEARFFYGNMFYSGTVLNLSEKGMFIGTKTCLPSDSLFLIIIRIKNELLRVLARVKQVSKTDGYYDGMGVELVNPSVGYLEFINGLKTAVQKV